MKIVVAYSGGLDTSVMIHWLKEKYQGAEIIAVNGDLGNTKESVNLKEKALATGASKFFIKNLQKEFIEDYIFPTLKAGALYEGIYPLATAIGRPLLAKYMVDIARQEGATHIAHGCTGKGNDQVRFEVVINTLAPDLGIIAPLREWEFKSREEEIGYAKKNNIPVNSSAEKPYSIDENLWGTSIECGVLEDPNVEPPEDAWLKINSVENTPDKPAYLKIGFSNGIPLYLDGEKLDYSLSLIKVLNILGANHGVGRMDVIENRLVGIKSRELYEAPAATILHFAYTELERLVLDKKVFDLKHQLSNEYANLVYNGLWFSPLREVLNAFVDETQKHMTGEVTVKLFKGKVSIVGRTSPFSLYNKELATYTSEDKFDHTAAAGFIKIFGLPAGTYYKVKKNNE